MTYLLLSFFFKTKDTVFHYCAREGSLSVLKEILTHLHSGQIQLAVNKQAHNGWSPLIVAASKGHTDICMVNTYSTYRTARPSIKKTLSANVCPYFT